MTPLGGCYSNKDLTNVKMSYLDQNLHNLCAKHLKKLPKQRPGVCAAAEGTTFQYVPAASVDFETIMVSMIEIFND